MKTARYLCTHCGKRFEAEEREIMECPSCFWTTSVKKDDGVSAPDSASVAEPVRSSKPAFSFNFLPLLKILGIFLGIALVGWGILALLPKIKTLAPKKSVAPVTIPQPAVSIAPVVPVKVGPRIQLTADRTLSDAENKILANRASFQTGLVEKLPSQPWNLENYKNMIAEQERFYKVPLPGSYKKKLLKLFESQYQPGAEAFTQGDLLKARDAWVSSLAFPIYADNVQKHRGVVLTMLRPFITDTLSKVGTINSTIIEKSLREKEETVTRSYGEFLQLIEAKSWQPALAKIEEIRRNLNDFSGAQHQAIQAPQYPPAVNQVDEAIRATLFELLQVPPPATSDLMALQQDIEMKKRVLQSMQPELLTLAQQRYDEIATLIENGKIDEAQNALRQAELPIPLYDDLRQRIDALKTLSPVPSAAPPAAPQNARRQP